MLGLTPDGRAFSDISPDAIHRWWGRNGFNRPGTGERLTLAPLALLAAIRSSDRGTPLFQSPEVLARLLQDGFRNKSAHHVITATVSQVDQQLGYAQDFLEQLAVDGGCSFKLVDVQRFVRPPRAFLGGLIAP